MTGDKLEERARVRARRMRLFVPLMWSGFGIGMIVGTAYGQTAFGLGVGMGVGSLIAFVLILVVERRERGSSNNL